MSTLRLSVATARPACSAFPSVLQVQVNQLLRPANAAGDHFAGNRPLHLDSVSVRVCVS